MNGEYDFTIEDNGIGIAKNQQEKIFVMFKRLNAHEEYEGTGIGLAHCKKIADLHHGKIWVDSIPGYGSKFHFTLKDLKNMAIYSSEPETSVQENNIPDNQEEI